MKMEGIPIPAQVQTLTAACQAQGHSLVMVAVADELVGCNGREGDNRVMKNPIQP